MNISLGGGFSQALNSAVAKAVTAGLVVVVSAGDDGSNACNYSPASEPLAFTVGTIDNTDHIAPYSSFGKCMIIFPPCPIS